MSHRVKSPQTVCVAKGNEKKHETEFLQECKGDGEVKREGLTNLLSEAKDKERKHVTELFQSSHGDGEVYHEELTSFLSVAKDK